mmetsp:Transcript_71888/g.222226  ORF Transcript_71888/g.222226 Transcript_71888/m.222226 type:complete len:258 (+) Transcript_71888:445-1218(+)
MKRASCLGPPLLSIGRRRATRVWGRAPHLNAIQLPIGRGGRHGQGDARGVLVQADAVHHRPLCLHGRPGRGRLRLRGRRRERAAGGQPPDLLPPRARARGRRRESEGSHAPRAAPEQQGIRRLRLRHRRAPQRPHGFPPWWCAHRPAARRAIACARPLGLRGPNEAGGDGRLGRASEGGWRQPRSADDVEDQHAHAPRSHPLHFGPASDLGPRGQDRDAVPQQGDDRAHAEADPREGGPRGQRRVSVRACMLACARA